MQNEELGYGVPDETERAATTAILSHAFPRETEGGWLEQLGVDNLRVLRGTDGVRACLAVIPMGMFMGGRSIAIEGIAGVGVRSDCLRRGVASELMCRVLRTARARGAAASCLYASTWSLYRGVGYECAGTRQIAKLLPLMVPRFRDHALPVRQATADDLPAVQALYRSTAADPMATSIANRNVVAALRCAAWRGGAWPLGR